MESAQSRLPRGVGAPSGAPDLLVDLVVAVAFVAFYVFEEKLDDLLPIKMLRQLTTPLKAVSENGHLSRSREGLIPIGHAAHTTRLG